MSEIGRYTETFMAGGTLKGSHPLSSEGRIENNQDAFYIYQDDEWMIGTICDGCGSGRDSHVGSSLAAIWLTNWMHNHGLRFLDDLSYLSESVTKAYIVWLQAQINILLYAVKDMKDYDILAYVRRYFLHTAIILTVNKRTGHTIACFAGDGYIVIDGRILAIDELIGYNSDRGVNYPALALFKKKYPHIDSSFHAIQIDGYRCSIWSDGFRFIMNDSEFLQSYLTPFAEGKDDIDCLQYYMETEREMGNLNPQDDLTGITLVNPFLDNTQESEF